MPFTKTETWVCFPSNVEMLHNATPRGDFDQISVDVIVASSKLQRDQENFFVYRLSEKQSECA